MKKASIILLVIILMIGVVGCNEDNSAHKKITSEIPTFTFDIPEEWEGKYERVDSENKATFYYTGYEIPGDSGGTTNRGNYQEFFSIFIMTEDEFHEKSQEELFLGIELGRKDSHVFLLFKPLDNMIIDQEKLEEFNSVYLSFDEIEERFSIDGGSETETNISESQKNKLDTNQINPLLNLTYEGKVDGIEFGLGANSSEIVEKWGMPDEYDYFAGGVYLAYVDKNVVFFTDGHIIDNEIDHGNVRRIWSERYNNEIYNIKIGMTFNEIIEVLDKPDFIRNPQENENSEFYYEKWTIIYNVGEYSLVFLANEEEGPVDSVSLNY